MTRYLIVHDAVLFTRHLSEALQRGFRIRKLAIGPVRPGRGPACFARLERGLLGRAWAGMAGGFRDSRSEPGPRHG